MKLLTGLKQKIIRRLRGDFHLFKGDNVVLEESSGNIIYQYNFSPSGEVKAEHLKLNNWWSKDSVIRYHIPNTGYGNQTAERVCVSIADSTIHELSHWAADSTENKAAMQDKHGHSKRWRKAILNEIDYVNDDVHILVG